MDQLRHQLAEECARQQLEGKAPSAATLRLLRRVANSELCSRGRLWYATDLARALPALAKALEESLLRRPGWLTLELCPGPAPVGLPAYPAAALLLNGLWLQLQAPAPGVVLRLSPWGEGWRLEFRGAEGEDPALPRWEDPLSDWALTARTLDHLCRLGGGRFLMAASPRRLSLACFLPASRAQETGFYSPARLVEDRFSPLHLFLAGYTVPPDWPD